ncbi:MAG: 50S ribosomal protein L29 [candidate division Zixibacteria bacterium]|nr:50S ribosomal protein L29 [candidate division Zixibacteria bacterium]
MNKVPQFRELTRAELEQKRAELMDEKFNLRMQKSLRALDNPLRLRQIRREVAQVMTILREDETNIKKLAETTTTVLGDAKTKDKKK